MTQREAKYWGKIDEADAARAESILEQGEKEKPGRIPFVNITVADAPEIKTVRESVERVIHDMRGNAVVRSADYCVGSGRPRDSLGHSINVTGLERESPWYLIRPGARSRSAEWNAETSVGG